MADLIIKNGYVLTMDPERRILSDGAVAIAGSRIIAVGRTDAILGAHRADEVIDATDKIVLPGIIDGHNHPFSYLFGGAGDDMSIFDVLYERFYPYEVHISEEEAYWGCLANYSTMIKNGTTCFNDPGGYHVDALAQAAVDSGIRGIVNRSTRDIAPQGKPVPKELFDSLEDNLSEGEKVVKKWHGAADDRIRAWFSLRYVFNISDELANGIGELARQHGVGVHAHAAAVRGENELVQEIFGKRSLERYYDLGLFGPNLYLVHMGYPNEREVGWLKEHDVKVAHCPTAAMTGAWGVIVNKMIPYMIDQGIAVSIGTDTNGAAGMIDMFRVIYTFAGIHRDMHDDPTLIGSHKALEHATIVGARACLWDDQIGSLEVGKKADLILVDWNELEWLCPARDRVRTLVYGTNGNYVDTVVIDGRVVMRGRELMLVDEEELKRKVLPVGRDWPKRAGFEVAPDWPVVV